MSLTPGWIGHFGQWEVSGVWVNLGGLGVKGGGGAVMYEVSGLSTFPLQLVGVFPETELIHQGRP